jgi:hypothetical protein
VSAISKRCLHCHAESSLAFAERALAEQYPDLNGKNYPGATGALQFSVQHLLDPTVTWELCSKHRRIQRAARAGLERTLREQVEADQRAWQERQGGAP